jgi:hypothetical protein
MAKKAQGISMNVIIIAAIALLVLVILSVVFIGRMGTFSGETAGCASKGGTCYEGGCPQGTTPFSSGTCAEEGEACCLPVGA